MQCLTALVIPMSFAIISGSTFGLDQPTKSFTPVVDPSNNDASMCAVDPPTAVLPLADVSVGIPDEVPGSVICSFGCTGFLGCLSFNYRQQQLQAARARCEFYNYIPRNCTVDMTGLCQHYEVTGQMFSSCFPTECDPHCTSRCTRGYLHCDTSCEVGYGLNHNSFICEGLQPTNCNILSSSCHLNPSSINLRSTMQYDGRRLCTNFQCSSCVAGYGISKNPEACLACNSTNCNSSCNQYGPGTCDGPCTPGYYLNTTLHICIAYRYRHIGCYVDSPTRDLTPEIWSLSTMTPSYCADSCQYKGYTYAGVQAGSYCLCGNTYGRYGPATSCNMQCTGDSSQLCGDEWANDVMQCGCDPNCNSIVDCSINGAGKCDSLCKSGWNMTSDHFCKRCDPQCATACTNFQCSSCVAGYGISMNPEVCLECDTPYCLGSCNNYGPGTCDGPCQTGYSLNATMHICN